MKYPFITFPDDTVITHSDIFTEDGKDKILVYIEQPTEDSFLNATCVLPDYSWHDVNGFSDSQIDEFQKFIEKGVHVIYKFARQGGFGNAANF